MTKDHRFVARIAGVLLAVPLLFSGAVAAQNAPSPVTPRVVEVRVVTESGRVLEENPERLALKSGEQFTLDAESDSLRELFRSGQYADLRAEISDVPEGVRLDFVVQPNFYVNRVQIVGLREPPSESVALAALRLNLGEVFREIDMKEAMDRLQQTLADEGLYQAKATYELTPHADTLQMDILVRIVPGIRARLGELTIQNQTEFPDSELRGRLRLKEGREINSDRLNRASERARKWLANKDYLGARITLNRGTYNARTNRVPLEAAFYAGLQVRVRVEGATVPSRTLRKLLPIYEEGSVDEDLLQEGRRMLREWFERAGYFDAQVNYTTADSDPGKSGGKIARCGAGGYVSGRSWILPSIRGRGVFGKQVFQLRVAYKPVGNCARSLCLEWAVFSHTATGRCHFDSKPLRCQRVPHDRRAGTDYRSNAQEARRNICKIPDQGGSAIACRRHCDRWESGAQYQRTAWHDRVHARPAVLRLQRDVG